MGDREIKCIMDQVQERIEVFDTIYGKIYDTDDANEKEKLKADLKEEIKKLHGYRNQIRTWWQSSKIKNNKAMIEAYKLIERDMDRLELCKKVNEEKSVLKRGP